MRPELQLTKLILSTEIAKDETFMYWLNEAMQCNILLELFLFEDKHSNHLVLAVSLCQTSEVSFFDTVSAAESVEWTAVPVDHGQGFTGFDLVPSESEREASGQFLDAAVGLNPGAACVSSVLLLFQPQIQLNTHRKMDTNPITRYFIENLPFQ